MPHVSGSAFHVSMAPWVWACLGLLFVLPTRAVAQVNDSVATVYFSEVTALCRKDNGQLWGASLCGPLAIVDAATKTRATNAPEPAAAPPPTFGYANAAIDWGNERWSTIVWSTIPKKDPRARGRLFIHELFHRIQPTLRLVLPDLPNPHLDTLRGRYWIRLEWRALARALETSGADRAAAVADALAFRARRFREFPEAAVSEPRMELNEGLAEYTGTVVAAPTREAALADARERLGRIESEPTFVRVFPYPSGAAYGLLLDQWARDWARSFTDRDDLASRLAAASGISAAVDADAAAERYGGPALALAESAREAEHRARVEQLRREFVDGPVLVLPRVGKVQTTFTTTGMIAIPDAGTVSPNTRVSAIWGELNADVALMTPDSVVVRAPEWTDDHGAAGRGWTLSVGRGWKVVPGPRQGDYTLVQIP